MGRKRKQPTRMQRITLVDQARLRELAKMRKISVVEMISRMTRRAK